MTGERVALVDVGSQRLDHLDDRAYELFDFLRRRKGTLIDYGKPYRAGKPVSTAMAESAVDQVINARDGQAPADASDAARSTLQVQVRCPVINGGLAGRLRRRSPPPPQSPIPIVVTEPAMAQTPRFLDRSCRAPRPSATKRPRRGCAFDPAAMHRPYTMVI